MKKIIEIKNLNYNLDKINIFENLNLNIYENDFMTICGPNGSGKTQLFHLILDSNDYSGEIIINGTKLTDKNRNKILKKIGYVNNDINNFVFKKAKDNIVFPLQNLGYANTTIDKCYNELVDYFGIQDICQKKIQELSSGQKQLINIVSTLISEPKILLMDNSLLYLDQMIKEKVLNYLKKINKEKKITIILISNNLNDSLYGKTITVLNNNKITSGTKQRMFEEEKLFKTAKIELPFLVDLSNKLKYYGLTDKILIDKNKLVNIIWK